MPEKIFIRVEEVARVMEVSKPYAYDLIRTLNQELKAKGCITVRGRVDRKYFYEKFYGTKTEKRGE